MKVTKRDTHDELVKNKTKRQPRNGTKVLTKLIPYIVESIDNPDDCDFSEKTKREKVEYMKKTFHKEKQWEIDRYNERTACLNWLQGLCSTVPIVFYNSEILEMFTKWGLLSDNPTETQEFHVLDTYWGLCATACLKLMNAPKNSKYFN